MAMVGRSAGQNGAGDSHIHGDVFPTLGTFVGSGLVCGVAAVLALAALGVTHERSLHTQCPLGGAVGGILGLFTRLGL